MCVCVDEQPNINSAEEIVFCAVSRKDDHNALYCKWRYCRLRLSSFLLVLEKIKHLSVVAFKTIPCDVYKTDEPET